MSRPCRAALKPAPRAQTELADGSEPSGAQAQALTSWDTTAKRSRVSGFSPDMKDTHGQPHGGYIQGMIRTHVFPCSLSKAEADALNRESGRVYTSVLVRTTE